MSRSFAFLAMGAIACAAHSEPPARIVPAPLPPVAPPVAPAAPAPAPPLASPSPPALPPPAHAQVVQRVVRMVHDPPCASALGGAASIW